VSVVVDVKVIPRAGRTSLAGMRDGAVLIRLAAAPVEGAANSELIDFFSTLLDVPKRNITIISGEKSRQKRVRIDGVTAEIVSSLLRRG
jgi:uncharacterized protein (TIGR00251 family)